MGVVSRLLRPTEQRDSTLKNPDRALIDALRGGIGTAAGVYVSDEGALAYGAVLACVRVLSESVASLPCILYERVDDHGHAGKRRATEHPLYRVLHNKPNPEMSAFEFWEMALVHLLLWGNFYSEIVVDGRGDVIQLWPIPPNLVTPTRLKNKRLVYDVELAEEKRRFDAEWMLHVVGLRASGLKGLSVVGLAREAIGLGMAAEQYGAAVFGNGTVPGGVLEHPGILTDDAYARIERSWKERHEGLSNAQRVAILEEGMKYNKIGIPPEDAQFLETRKFQRSEIAGMFRVPPHMIADLDRATFSNIEQQSLEFVRDSLQPWLRRIEGRVNGWLLQVPEQDSLFAEFLIDGLLRGDVVSRNQAYSTARQWGWMSVNEIRTRENLNPIAEGDVYLQPMNMIEAGAPTPPPTPPRSGEGSRSRMAELRSDEEIERIGRGRQQMAASYRRNIEESARRLINREINDVRNAARKRLGERSRVAGEQRSVAEFEAWLDEFYRDFDHVAREYLLPTMQTLAELTRDDVEREIGQQWPDNELETWIYNYADSRAGVWCGQHRRRLLEALRAERSRSAQVTAGQILAVLSTPSATRETTDEDALARIEVELDDMQEQEPQLFSSDQAIRIINAVATTIYAWFVIRMRWFSFGESCDYCSQLNGRIVGPSQWFLSAGDTLVDAAQVVLRIGHNVKHAPLHDGCDCQVLAHIEVPYA